MIYHEGNIGHEIRRRRKALKMSLDLLAKQSGVSKPTLVKAEHNPDHVLVTKIKDVLATLERFEKK